jgi:hypothetical protein
MDDSHGFWLKNAIAPPLHCDRGTYLRQSENLKRRKDESRKAFQPH